MYYLCSVYVPLLGKILPFLLSLFLILGMCPAIELKSTRVVPPSPFSTLVIILKKHYIIPTVEKLCFHLHYTEKKIWLTYIRTMLSFIWCFVKCDFFSHNVYNSWRLETRINPLDWKVKHPTFYYGQVSHPPFRSAIFAGSALRMHIDLVRSCIKAGTALTHVASDTIFHSYISNVFW